MRIQMDYESFLNHRDDYLKFDEMNGTTDDDPLFTNYQALPKKRNFTPFIPATEDRVNAPKHYTYGKAEAIDVIESAMEGAPSQKAGFNQGQALKYLLRLWHKDNSLEDARKAEWYLKRLIDQLQKDNEGDIWSL